MLTPEFFIRNIMLGLGLAMDAFSVSLANGLREPDMSKKKACGVAGIFAGFQGVMPLIGWVCVHTVLSVFKELERFIPWIALALLLFIGIKMVVDGIKDDGKDEIQCVGLSCLLIQGVATSIDALSVGFTIATYDFWLALVAVAVISLVTFAVCLCGVFIGKRFGNKLAGKATVFGGIILILIGLEIFLTGIIA